MMADWLQRITESKENKPVSARGGTEILLDAMIKHSKFSEYDNLNLLLATPDPSKVRYTKKNILWQHLNYSDESLSPMKDNAFMKSIDATVYVSHWQLEKFRYLFQVPLHNAHVIRNAIEPIEFKPKSKDGKLKLIYTSTPFRGLSVLLDVMQNLNRDDIELDVYSSTSVYGSGYESAYYGVYDDLFNKARETKNVNYMGYASNEDIHKALQEAHIFSYPSIFEETACLSMIEAGAAGCSLVTTDLGALPETGSVYSKMMTIKSDEKQIVNGYTELLNDAIDNYWSADNQNLIREQSDFYNKYYNWEARAKEWNELFERITRHG
jgi:glycosyltransferase involved in cell wall biosynthesis